MRPTHTTADPQAALGEPMTQTEAASVIAKARQDLAHGIELAEEALRATARPAEPTLTNCRGVASSRGRRHTGGKLRLGAAKKRP